MNFHLEAYETECAEENPIRATLALIGRGAQHLAGHSRTPKMWGNARHVADALRR
jgi:hypothetical protein